VSLVLLELFVLVVLPALLVLALIRRRVTPPPGYVLVVHGRRGPNGRGRAVVRETTFVLPLLESAELLPISALRVACAISAGPELVLSLRASVRLPDEPLRLLTSLELLGGRSRAAIEELARDALEGTLSHRIAGLELAEVARDPERIGRLARDDAEAALRGIGLELEALALTRFSA
jgi:uncharacterized membrane protein YqiK